MSKSGDGAVSEGQDLHLASEYVKPMPRRDRCRVRIFVADEQGERFGDRPVVLCSEGGRK